MCGRYGIVRRMHVSAQARAGPTIGGQLPQQLQAAYKQRPSSLALAYFDQNYPQFYGENRWRSIRLALLSKRKHVALLNNFAYIDKQRAVFNDLGAFDRLSSTQQRYNRLWKHSLHEENAQDPAASTTSTHHQQQQEEMDETPSRLEHDTHSFDVRQVDVRQVDARQVDARQVGVTAAEEAGMARLVPAGDDVFTAVGHVPASELYGDEQWLEEGEYQMSVQHTPRLSPPNSEYDRGNQWQYVSGDNEQIPINVVNETAPLQFPSSLHVYAFPVGDISRFPAPHIDNTGCTDYLPMDGGSILPVLALNLAEGDTVLDMCAAPGAKTLAILQTLLPKLLVCNDTKQARLTRLQSIINQYLPQAECKRPTQVKISCQDGCTLRDINYYDKVLVDVPCFADRHCVVSQENNIFSLGRCRERIVIADMQIALLKRALQCARPGGTVVYSTCTLSPVQNDGVVQMTVRALWESVGMRVEVVNVRPLVQAFCHRANFLLNVARYGQQVMPNIVDNFGPTYVAKLVRVN